MTRNLNDFYVSSIGSCAGDAQSASGQRALIFAVEFITVAMALADLELTVSFVRQRARFDFARPCAQAHRAPEFFNAAQLAQFVDHSVWGGLIELRGICFFQPADVAGKFDACGLHAQTNS